MTNEPCKVCKGTTHQMEYIYSINRIDVYYCVACDTEAHAKPVEYVTPEVVLGELYGE
jgi:hypothetical protein|tara:strand:- start:211 stop:384 length:174 start_codon:yes stop_codon:yes gene_type:complete